MPSSYVDAFAPIVHTLIDLAPERVIDIGPGWGKYGLACREYLPALKTLRAVEVRPGRLGTQDAIYDMVYSKDVRHLRNPNFWARFDLALLIDVIEHMPLADGHALLNLIQGAGCQVLVSTPKEFFEQHDDENPYEDHLSLWDWQQLEPHGVERDISTISSIIYVLKAAPTD